jgi:Family of unknown function (DUF6874)
MTMREENRLISQIGNRAELEFRKHGRAVRGDFIASEVWIVHSEVCKLRLEELLAADEGNFMHDICGIHDHLDILDGSFRDGFTPRFTK